MWGLGAEGSGGEGLTKGWEETFVDVERLF